MSGFYGRKLFFLFFTYIAFYLQGFFLVPILSRSLGIEAYGVWSQIRVAVDFLVPFCLLALPASFVRFSAGEKDKCEIARNYYTVLSAIIFGGIVICGVYFLFSGFIGRTFIKTEKSVVSIVELSSILILARCLSQYSVDYFRTFQREKLFSFLQLVPSVAIILMALVLVRNGYGLFQIIFAIILIYFALYIYAQILIAREIGWSFPDFRLLKRFLYFSLPLFPVSILHWIISLSDRYVIGYFLPVTAVATYSACYMLSMVIIFFYAPFYAILPAKLTELWEGENQGTLQRVFHYSNKLPLLIAIPAVFGLTILSVEILRMMTGKDLPDALIVVPVVCAGYLFLYIGGFYVEVFSLAKKTKYTTFGHGIAAVTNIIGNIIHVPVMGIVGAAIMTMFTFFVQMLYFMKKSKNFYDINLKWNFLWKCLAGALVMAITLLLIKPWLLQFGDLVMIFASIIIAAVIYAGVVLSLDFFGKDDLELVKAMFGRPVKIEADRES